MKHYRLEHNKKTSQNTVLITIICVFLSALFFSFMFRDAIVGLPLIQSKKAVLSFEELVPIYNIKTQLSDQLFQTTSEITSNPEIRIGYSIVGTWMRHFAVMPIMLVLVPTLTVFLVAGAFRKIACVVIGPIRQARSEDLLVVLTFVFSFIVTLILVYSKIAHFYTLVLGFGLFAFAISQVYYSIEKGYIDKKTLILIFFATLLNPSIHLIVLTLFCVILYFSLKAVLQKLGSGSKVNYKLVLKITGTLVAASIIYTAWIYATVLSKNLSTETIAYTYDLIYNSSVPILHSLLLHTASQLDNILYGFYIIEFPRLAGLFILLIAITPLLVSKHLSYNDDLKEKHLTLYILLIIFILLSTGFKFNEHINIYSLASFITNHLPFTSSFIDLPVNILRLSHRFQFPAYLLAGVLATIGSYELLKGRKTTIQATAICSSLLLIILLGTNFKTILSGNTSGYLKPNTIVAADLTAIKGLLEQRRAPSKIAVFPSLELGRDLATDQGRLTFIDKTVLYYINQPGWYYGAGAPEENRIFANYLYNVSDKNEDEWIKLLSAHIGVTHIVAPTSLIERPGSRYYSGVENKVINELNDEAKIIYKGDSFSLYEVKALHNSSELSIDGTSESWLDDTAYVDFTPTMLGKDGCPSKREAYVSTSTISTVLYDCITEKMHNISIYEHVNKLSSGIVFSSTYSNNAFSIRELANTDSDYNYTKLAVPNLINMKSAAFAAARYPKKDVTVKHSNCYSKGSTVLLRALSEHPSVTLNFTSDKPEQSERLTLTKVNDQSSFFTYYKLKPDSSFCFKEMKILGNQIALDTLTITNSDVEQEYNRYSISELKEDFYKIKLN